MPDGNNSQTTMTMSKQFYLNEDVYEKEKEKIFYREWICIGHISQLPAQHLRTSQVRHTTGRHNHSCYVHGVANA